MNGNTRIIFLILIGACVASSIFFIILFNDAGDKEQSPQSASQTETEKTMSRENDPIEWNTYTNEMYGFSIKYPSTWVVSAFPEDTIAPTFNFYPKGSITSQLPLTHHSDTEIHVSVFPHGVPTEGFFGEAIDTNVTFSVTTESARDYVLSDNTRFATIAFIGARGPNWTPSGFVFAHVPIKAEMIRCVRMDEEVPASNCDPLMGDVLIRDGEVDQELRQIEEQMLASFRFIK